MKGATLDVKPLAFHPNRIKLGLLAALATVVIWSIYFISLRAGALSPLTAHELALFRYTVPGLLLAPIAWKSRHQIMAVPRLYLLGIILGAGLPFFLLSIWAIKHGNVLQASTLIPGTAPLFVSLLAVILFKQKIGFWRLAGLALISLGIFTFLAQALLLDTQQLLFAMLAFLLCACLWAIFTLSLRQAQLSPLQAASLITVSNGFAILLWVSLTQPEMGAFTMPLGEVLTQVVVQGIIVGVFSSVFYGYAILRIGAESTSAVASLTPVTASVLAWLILGDHLSFIGVIALTLTTIGVLLASGVIHKDQTKGNS